MATNLIQFMILSIPLCLKTLPVAIDLTRKLNTWPGYFLSLVFVQNQSISKRATKRPRSYNLECNVTKSLNRISIKDSKLLYLEILMTL